MPVCLQGRASDVAVIPAARRSQQLHLAPVIRKARRRASRSRTGRATLLWGLVIFVSVQLLLSCVIERRQPELRDPEYGYKLRALQAAMIAEPDRAILLVLGSSRVALGIRPDSVAPAPPSVGLASPLLFNCGLTAAGPVTELLCLHRLLAAGIRPAWVVIEVVPPLLYQDYAGFGGSDRIEPARLDWNDLSRLRPYVSLPSFSDHPDETPAVGLPFTEDVRAQLTLYGQWLSARLLPVLAHRSALLSRLAPLWVAWDNREDFCGAIDRWGWLPHPNANATVEQRRRGLERTRRDYGWRLEAFHVSPLSDRALREMLDLCRRETIPTMLLLMPESSDFRSWYPATTCRQLDSYLAGLSGTYGVSVIDTRTWMADADFIDGHHLLPASAAVFTRRLESEVLQPWCAGRSVAVHP